MYNSNSSLDVEWVPINGSEGDSLNRSTTTPKGLTDEEIMKIIYATLFPFKSYQWIYIIIFSVVFIVGTGGNFLVCYSVWRCKELKSVTNQFLVNLAVADFLVIVTCLPANLVYEHWRSWFLGDTMCKLFVYVQRVSLYVSVLTLTVISVERYLAICHPLRRHTTSLKTKLSIIGIWIVSLVTPCNDFINIGVMHHDTLPANLRPWLTQCKAKDEEIERDFQIFDMTMFYIVPLCVMAFTYSSIAVCLWTSTMTNNAVTHNIHHESGVEQLRMRKRTAKMLIVVVIIFGLCYLPINIVNIIRYTGALDNFTNEFHHYLLFQTIKLLLYFNSAINPVIYNFMSAKFRKQFKSACFGCYSCFSKSSIDGGENRSSNSFISRTNNVRMTLMGAHNSG